MHKQRGVYEVISALIVLAVVFVIITAVQAYRCGDRWVDSGMLSKYGLFSGCMIRLKDGKWIPEDRYRELDE